MLSEEVFCGEDLLTILLSIDLCLVVAYLIHIVSLVSLHVLVGEVLLNTLLLCLTKYLYLVLLLISFHQPRMQLHLGNGGTFGWLWLKQSSDQTLGCV
jgi:hypothetical protein